MTLSSNGFMSLLIFSSAFSSSLPRLRLAPPAGCESPDVRLREELAPGWDVRESPEEASEALSWESWDDLPIVCRLGG
jgi:hypothetical protein